MRQVGLFVAAALGLAAVVYGQKDVLSDAKNALSVEWQSYPEHCLQALTYEFAEQPNQQLALQELQRNQALRVQRLYDHDLHHYPNFWQIVVMAPPAGGPGDADAACKKSSALIKGFYGDDSKFPILERVNDRYPADSAGALYLLLEAVPRANPGDWKDGLDALRVCYASDAAGGKKTPPGTTLFKFVASHFPAE